MLFMLVAPFGKSSAAPERCVFVATHYSTLKHASNKNFVNCFPSALISRIARHNSHVVFNRALFDRISIAPKSLGGSVNAD